MYSYVWDKKTRGYKLTTETGKYVANEIRPVFAPELISLNADKLFEFDVSETRPLLWNSHNSYYYNGEECAKVEFDSNGNPFLASTIVDSSQKIKILPVDVEKFISINKTIMDSLVANTLKRIKEMYEINRNKCDIAYIGFSGGKDSMVLLDMCHQVLPFSIPVIFSNTDMELPDTITTWEQTKKRYFERPFVEVKADRSAEENWNLFGPPSQNLRWCCSVHKSTPAILWLRNASKKPNAKTLVYVGVRSEESQKRSQYDDIGDGLKAQNQINVMPLLDWGAHELFLYTLEHHLIINDAYKKGLPRVGCLLCPMSNKKQVKLIRNLYTEAFLPFISSIKQNIDREFSSLEDEEAFIYEGGWHARKSGVSLKDIIPAPNEKIDNNCVCYDFQPIRYNSIIEWMKTLGRINFVKDTNEIELSVKDAVFTITLDKNDNGYCKKLKCNFEDRTSIKKIIKLLKSIIYKSLGCVNCRACECECPTGALTFNGGIHVNTEKCIHCLKCHSPQNGCMRYFSKRYAGGTTMNISGINKYMTFGLKPEWIQVLSEEKENFRSTTALGNRMIPSAVTWFREAKLISDSKNIQTSRLLTFGENNGFDSEMLWSQIWIALANNSPLIKWYVSTSAFDCEISIDELNQELAKQVASESVRKGALQSLCVIIKNSPIGKADKPFVEVSQKGSRTLGLKRVRRSIEPLAVLYSLYLMAEVAGRTSFTLSEMMTADFESPCISPLVAFGMSVEELKGQCMGISSIYPDYLTCNFTLGLDEVRVYPNEKTLDDVIGLMLGE